MANSKKGPVGKVADDLMNPPKRRAIIWTVIIAGVVVYVMMNGRKIKAQVQRGYEKLKGVFQ